MRIHEGEVVAFALGGWLSWLATKRAYTADARAVAKVRAELPNLAYHCGANDVLYRKATRSEDWVDDASVLRAWEWARRWVKEQPRGRRRPDATILAACIVVCERLLKLSGVHALRALSRSGYLEDLAVNLRDVKAEIEAEEAAPPLL